MDTQPLLDAETENLPRDRRLAQCKVLMVTFFRVEYVYGRSKRHGFHNSALVVAKSRKHIFGKVRGEWVVS